MQRINSVWIKQEMDHSLDSLPLPLDDMCVCVCVCVGRRGLFCEHVTCLSHQVALLDPPPPPQSLPVSIYPPCEPKNHLVSGPGG